MAQGNEVTVASLLRAYRLSTGLSQFELAERANISVGAIGSLEQGLRTAPYPATLDRLGEALALTADQRRLLGEVAKRGRGRRRSHEPEPAFQSNVPTALTSFVDREETTELEELSIAHRLITVTGSAGVGKTRTVLEVVGRNRSSDVFFIDLSPITDGSLVATEIASALNVSVDDTTTALSSLAPRLRDRLALIVLDNCEHVLDGASTTVMSLLRSCPKLRFIATSREPLALSNEVVFRLPSLGVPPANVDVKVASEFPALELFVTRARAADARCVFSHDDLQAAAGICRSLDGIPLAIELAAGRVPLIGLTSLRDRIYQLPLENAAKDVPARHQTMGAAIAWSFALLNPREQILLRRMSALAGAFTLACAHGVCADDQLPADTITRLVLQLARKSLIETKAANPEYRYALLESVRAYAAAELAVAGEVDATVDRLAKWLLDVVHKGRDHGLATVISMLPDLDNIRGAIEAKLRIGTANDVAIAGELLGSYRHLWISTNRHPELRQLCEAVAAKLDEGAYVDVAAVVASAMAGATMSLHRVDFLERAIELCTKAGDFASAAAHLSKLAQNLTVIDQVERAVETALLSESVLERVPPAHRAQHYVRTNIAGVFIEGNDVARARRTIVELDRLKAEQHAADDPNYLLWKNSAVVEMHFAENDCVSASALCEDTFARYRDVLPLEPMWLALRLAWISSDIRLGHLDRATANSRQFIEERDTFVEYGFEPLEILIVQSVAAILASREDLQNAGRLLARSDAIAEHQRYRRLRRERTDADELRDLLATRVDPSELRILQAEGAAMSLTETRALMTTLLS